MAKNTGKGKRSGELSASDRKLTMWTTPTTASGRFLETGQHEMMYRAGTAGIPNIADSSPCWYCTCGNWVYMAEPRRSVTGNNLFQAARAFRRHSG